MKSAGLPARTIQFILNSMQDAVIKLTYRWEIIAYLKQPNSVLELGQ